MMSGFIDIVKIAVETAIVEDSVSVSDSDTVTDSVRLSLQLVSVTDSVTDMSQCH